MRQHQLLSSLHVRSEPDDPLQEDLIRSPWIGKGNGKNEPVQIGPMTAEITDPVTGETKTIHGIAARGRTVTPELLETLRMVSGGRIAIVEPLPQEPLPTTNKETDDCKFHGLGKPLASELQREPGDHALDIISITAVALFIAFLAYLLVG